MHEQLAETSLMAFQNFIALDILLAEKGSFFLCLMTSVVQSSQITCTQVAD